MTLGSIAEVTALSKQERLAHYKDYLKAERERHYEAHKAGASGTEVCIGLSESMDILLQCIYSLAVAEYPEMEKMALVANGGYGRGRLNPGSDIDLLFLTQKASGSLAKGAKAGIDAILYPLWDLNLKVGHAVRNISENIVEGKKEPISRTTLLDSRLISGNEKLFTDFQKKYRKDAIENDKANFFQERSSDLEMRYDRYFNTIYLQEPNVKESPGGLRDWHNLLWLMDTALDKRDITDVSDEGVVSEQTAEEIHNSVDFLLRLRNEMHFHTGKSTDVLSLRLQGELVDTLNYEGEDILIKIENLMKDYYTHARNLHNRVKGIFELLDIEMESFKEQTLTSWLPWVGNPGEQKKLDGFYSQDGLLYAESEETFQQDSIRLLRAFYHCQKLSLSLSPSLRKLIKENLSLIDEAFLSSAEYRASIETIFGMRGRVGITLRAMHRVGLLGKIFPEFAPLDCLVQHEFFHRYTADEHTLRCIDMLDRLTKKTHAEDKLYGDLFQRMEDPLALYVALLLHDTGRALNTDDHVDGSNMLADEACKRLKITGERRRLIMFLVDHHLTFFQTGTKKDIDDPEVIGEFCAQMRSGDRLQTLLVFTYCDSNGTNPDGWNGWKELAITTLYKRARAHLKRSPQEVKEYVLELLIEQQSQVKEDLSTQYNEAIASHYEEMPLAYFRYRDTKSIESHVKAVWQYENRRKRRPNTPFEAAVQWTEHEQHGYTELCVVAADKRNLLVSICCALASHGINILSANVHTRSDGIALDLFRVCTSKHEALMDDILQMQIVASIYELNEGASYNPAEYIIEKKDYFQEDTAINVPPFVDISNYEDELCTTLEVQATDKIGLLHDLLRLFSKQNLITKGARILTERNTAIDTFLLQNADEEKLTDEESEKVALGVIQLLQ